MDFFTQNDLRQLLETDEGLVVSIYFPTIKSGREVQQNAIRFKNALKHVHQNLLDRGVNSSQATKRIRQAEHLEQNDEWWQNQSDSLAIFLGESRLDCFRIPLSIDEMVFVGQHFYIRPMVQLLQNDGRYYILAVSQGKVRLLESTHFSVTELDPEELPDNLRSALNIDEYTNTLQMHSTGKANVAGSMMFHGQGAADMDRKNKEEIKQYFRLISSSLKSYIDDEQTPLVFAGVDYLFPLFRETCDYKGLVEQPLEGSPDDLTAEQLRQQSWPIIEEKFQNDRRIALERYNDSVNSDKATDDLCEIVRAARHGIIDTLFVAEDQQRWGFIDDQTGSVTITEDNSGKAEELLNDATVHTLSTGGTVYTVSSDDLPGRKSVALLRCPVPQ